MSGFPFHVAGGSFCGGHSLLAEAMTPPALPKAQVAVGSRRRKLWEISHKFHCPIVGVCFECDELRRLMHKVMHLPRDASDFMLHTTAVGACEDRSRLAEILQKSLEKRYQLSIRQLAACKSVAELRRAWQAACRAKRDIPAVLWACWTHPCSNEQLDQEIYGDIHMIQHQLGAHDRTEQQALSNAQAKNAELQARLDAALADAEDLRQKRATQAQEAAQTIAQLRAELVAREAQASNLARASDSLREALPDLESRQKLAQRLADAEERARATRQENEELTRELTRLRDFAKYAEETIESLSRADEDDLAELPGPQLSGKCVLCVGGRSGSVNSYREVVEQSGGHFLHHDGGLEESLHRIDGALAAADIVICQAGCISHNAYWRVKEQCKRTGKPCMFVKNSGLGSFGRAVNALGKGNSGAGTDK